MKALATINVGNTAEIPEELRATLSYDQVARRIYSEAFGLPTEELDVRPETLDQAREDIAALYGNDPVWNLQWKEEE